ncbi:MAG: flavodoxin family protein [Fusobacteriaceae bacterium]|jgi:multimeric flavodoxin WrbA|nr:flavodoxin family protein [Fusobacteriaceae bacterium]
MRNIIVITGSSRKNGNSDLLANAFIEGATKAGHTVSLFEAGRKNISGCVGCETCYSTENACSFNDDFNVLAPMIENSDMIVFCTPLYWYTFPAKLKAAIDKMYSFLIGRRKRKGKDAILLACGDAHNDGDFDGLSKTYELILKSIGWNDAGQLLIAKTYKIGDINKTDGLEKAKNMGLNIKDKIITI